MNEMTQVISKLELEAQDVAVYFGGVRALDGIDVRFETGEAVGLIGPNGSGKSTLINTLTGYQEPTKGRVVIAGSEVHGVADRVARSGVRRTFQRTRLFPGMTVDENLALGGWADRGHLHLDELVERAQIAALRDRSVDTLSYGQSRIVAVLRALASSPSIVLLDEPAAGLNDEEQQLLLTLMQDVVARGVGVVLVEHSVPLVRAFATRLVVLNTGHKIFDGDAGVGFADQHVMRAYIGGEG